MTLVAPACGAPTDEGFLASKDTVSSRDPQAAESDAAASSPSSVAVIDTPATADQPADRVEFSWSAVTDPTRIPLGDGKISTSPQVDSLMSCQTTFDGRGAPHGGPWIDEANSTWDSTIKLSVLGSNAWPQAFYSESIDGVERVIEFSDLPTDHVTGNFPIDPDDPAYQYDRNPNGIEPKTIELRIPTDPVDATSPSCVSMGPIGVMANGVFIYNALDAAGADAAAHEVQDVCDGHPDGAEAYHYHDVPSCILDATPDTKGSTLIGFALDGYGIYVERDTRGNLPTNADLDDCHGRTSTVAWNGVEQEMTTTAPRSSTRIPSGAFAALQCPPHGGTDPSVQAQRPAQRDRTQQMGPAARYYIPSLPALREARGWPLRSCVGQLW